MLRFYYVATCVTDERMFQMPGKLLVSEGTLQIRQEYKLFSFEVISILQTNNSITSNFFAKCYKRSKIQS
jgi:hypothetical protein